MSSADVETEPVAIVDVHYGDVGAAAACVIARSWLDAEPIEAQVAHLSAVEPYRPGAFFERELPCILEVLSRVQTEYRVILIDGYVILDEKGTPGLGGHLYAHYGGTIPVVGLAKTSYRESSFAAKVLRGTSQSPLFVTAKGLPMEQAARIVAQMHGAHRIPTLAKRVDRLARAAIPTR